MKSKCILNSLSLTLSFNLKLSFIGKQLAPKIWHDDVCADLNEAEDLKPLNSVEFPFPPHLKNL